MTSRGRLARAYAHLSALATTGLGRPQDGRITWPRVVSGLVIPAFVFGLTISARPDLNLSVLLSAASIVAGVLLALCTLAMARVKDLVTEHNGDRWIGTDPMVGAYEFTRATVSATYLAFVVTGLLAIQLWVNAGLPQAVLLACSLTLATALAGRLWLLLGHMRYQLEAMAGQRSVRPTVLRRVN